MNLLKLTFYVGIANAILGVLALKKVLGTQPTNMLHIKIAIEFCNK